MSDVYEHLNVRVIRRRLRKLNGEFDAKMNPAIERRVIPPCVLLYTSMFAHVTASHWNLLVLWFVVHYLLHEFEMVA